MPEARTSDLATRPQDVHDLRPLTWILDQVHDSVDEACKAVKLFAREHRGEREREDAVAPADTQGLRMAAHELHKVVGALEMIEEMLAARMARAMEDAVQQLVARPAACTHAAAETLERGAFALVDYLRDRKGANPRSALGLFPQFARVQELAGASRIHPADLWPMRWQFRTLELPAVAATEGQLDAIRRDMNRQMLAVLRSGSGPAAGELAMLFLDGARSAGDPAVRAFHVLCAAFFEALAHGGFALDIYVKRAISRTLLQYKEVAADSSAVDERLLLDLLFFCEQAQAVDAQVAPTLACVGEAWKLARPPVPSYREPVFGLYDPQVLLQCRRRVRTAKESWSALVEGSAQYLPTSASHLRGVAESVNKLGPVMAPVALALEDVADKLSQSGSVPTAALGMEVATTLLFLEAMLDHFRPADTALSGRIVQLADRLHQVIEAGQMLVLDPWMEALYRDISDRQNIDTVVGELRVTLGEVEQRLDQYFRRPAEREHLNPVPALLAQMRGVLSVLGLEHGVSAVVRMRGDVEQLRESTHAEPTPALVEKLGNSLGVLGFLLDTLGYQPALARQLFYFDAGEGELKFAAVPARRTGQAPVPPVSAAAAELPGDVPGTASPVAAAEPATAAQTDPAAAVPGADDEGDLLPIFLDEARGVIDQGRQAVARLAQAPGDAAALTDLRRAFHTLKGSARMVDLAQFGAAAWSLEQLVNSWLARQQPATDDLCAVADAALQAQGRWIEALERGDAQAWRAHPFDEMADALRIHGQRRMAPLAPESARLPDAEEAEIAGAASVDDAAFASGTEDALPPAPDITTEDIGSGIAASEAAAAAAPPEWADTAQDKAADDGEDDLPSTPARYLHDSAFPDLNFAASEFHMGDLDDAAQPHAGAPAQPVADALPDKLLPGTPDVPDAPDASGADAALDDVVTGDEPAAVDKAAAPEHQHADADAATPDTSSLQQVGHLQLSRRLFDAYAEEATRWSGRLLAAVSQWRDDPQAPATARSSAHALAGSSATVGFSALAELAHELEHALTRVQELEHVTPAQLDTLREAAGAMQQSVVAFAAGQLEGPPPALADAVRAIWHEEADAATAEPAGQPAAAGTPAPLARRSSDLAAADPDATLDDAMATRFANTTMSDELWPIFEEEAAELLDQLSAAMRHWAQAPAEEVGHRQVLRILHTLKGSARLAEAVDLGDLVHETESVIEAFVKKQPGAVPPPAGIVHQVDRIHALFDSLCRHEEPPAPFELSGFAFNKTDIAAFEDDEDDEDDAGAGEQQNLAHATAAWPAAPDAPSGLPQAGAVDLPAPTVLSPDTVNTADHRRMVRVRASLLDHLMAQLGELVISRASLEDDIRRLRGSLADLASSIANLRRHLREVEMQAETQMQTRLAQNTEIDDKFDPLEFDRYTRMQELTRMMAEAVDDVATVQRNLQRSVEAGEDGLAAQVHQSRELQHALLRARMAEFEAVSERLYRLVRQVAEETGKQVNLRIVGGDLELDRSILDRLTAVFEHLLRNSIVHGIGTPAQRVADDLDATGNIILSAMPVGPDVVFEVRDDGAGLDLDRIRETALARGPVDAEQPASDHELAQLIFEPWFSSATTVTELAGRGVGLDVVRSEVRALGGHVAVTSRPGAGTTFRLVVPATQALTQVTLVRMGVMAVGIPSSLIDSVQEVVARKLTRAYEQGTMQLDGETLPFFWVGALLQHSRRGRVDPGRPSTVVVCRSAEQKVVVHVDEVMDELEVVIRPLGPQLSRLPGLVAVTVLSTGTIALIYNPVALANVYESQVRALMTSEPPGPDADMYAVLPLGPQLTQAANKALVLVVDDSITVRRVMERLLQRNGYRVALASDGLEGLAMLREERPAVILSDIEMPNMDGYDFVRQIRADKSLDDLPVVMITSRAADKHRSYAMELGANDYLGKPYSEAELLKLLENYTQQEALGSASSLGGL